ncbi:hypothetical protein AB0J38_00210 [Streptomyces sp. NPDC050095]|uniref:hypothetical protein n=1 Tax=unclassified Streptomyces TaxID=2593676 RepID=UPI0034239B34
MQQHVMRIIGGPLGGSWLTVGDDRLDAVCSALPIYLRGFYEVADDGQELTIVWEAGAPPLHRREGPGIVEQATPGCGERAPVVQ